MTSFPFLSPDEGAATHVVAAFDPELAGKYYCPQFLHGRKNNLQPQSITALILRIAKSPMYGLKTSNHGLPVLQKLRGCGD